MKKGMTNKDGLHTGTKPCEYSFQRFIGQRVSLWHPTEGKRGEGIITDISHYYTYVLIDGEDLVAYPQALRPLEPMPWLPEMTSFGATPKCDNCKGCDNYKSGWVCGNWEEVEAQPAEQIEWRF